MTVAQGIPFLIADRFQELVDPDTGVDGEAFLVEGFDLDGSCARLDDGPEAGHTHAGVARID
jgi:hypothetical protein